MGSSRTRKNHHPPKGTSVPKWAQAPFYHALDDIELLMRLVALSARAIAVLPGFRRLASMLAKSETPEDPETRRRRIDLLRQEDDLARAERQKDFPTLHALAVMSLWAILENLIRDFLAAWIVHKPEAKREPSISKLRIRLGDYYSLPGEARGLYVVDMIEQDLGSALRQGVNRFEMLLGCFRLSGHFDDSHAKAIYELQQVRNLLAHRNGRVDRRFRTACPWLKPKIGQQLLVTSEHLQRYHRACMQYIIELLYRVNEKFGHEMRKLSPEQIIALADALDRKSQANGARASTDELSDSAKSEGKQ